MDTEALQQLRADLDEFHYCMVKDFITKDEQELLLQYAADKRKSKKFNPIFKDTRERMDAKRLQRDFTALEVCLLKAKVDIMAKSMYNFWIPTNFVFLYSKAKGQEQEIHRDFHKKYAKMEKKPASALISIQEDTRLKVRDGYVDVPERALLIFSCDLDHAGCSYDEDHYRVHFHLFVENVPVDENVVGIAPKEYTCPTCGTQFDSLDECKEHSENECKK